MRVISNTNNPVDNQADVNDVGSKHKLQECYQQAVRTSSVFGNLFSKRSKGLFLIL